MIEGVKATTPLKLADGTIIDPVTRKPVRSSSNVIEIPAHSKLVKDHVKVQRKLSDLPIEHSKLPPIAAVVGMKLYGLSDEEIAVAIKCSVEQVKNLQTLDTYTELVKSITNNFVEEHSANIRHALLAAAPKAINKAIDLLDNAEDESVQLNAAKTILDRAGFTNKDVSESQANSMMKGLRIEVVHKGAVTSDELTITIGDENDR